MSTVWHRALNMLDTANVALEQQADGKLKREFEHVWFAHMVMEGVHRFPALEQAASWEYQEQWEIRIEKSELIPANGTVRCRMTRPGGDSFMDLGNPKYEFAVKVKGADGGVYECEEEVSEDIFGTFKWLCGRGMEKDRYFYPVANGGLIEVDMFLLPGLAQGRLKGMKNRGRDYCEWAKVDFEYSDPEAPLPEIPFETVQLIDGGSPHRKVKKTPEEDKILDHLFKEVFNSKNPMLPFKKT